MESDDFAIFFVILLSFLRGLISESLNVDMSYKEKKCNKNDQRISKE